MIHFSCDRCGRPIDRGEELRYVVRIEIEAVMEPLEDEVVDDEDRDHLMELHDLLENASEEDPSALGDALYQRKRCDLCAECYRKFVRNPIGRDSSTHFDFSQN